jgi:GT2 family glycosyltransferase
MTQTAPRVCIILVNWNRSDEVLRCLKRIDAIAGPSREIIIVDNGSTDGSLECFGQLRRNDVRLIALSANKGPSYARNAGLEAARSEYTFFLDSDALPGRWALAELVRSLDAEPTIGIAGCQILAGKSRRIDQWIYAQSVEVWRNRPFDTYSFSAAGAMGRTQVLKDVGGFWSDLFIYNEEVDLSIRVIRAGYRVVYRPSAKVFHMPASTGRVPSDAYWFYQVRNWIWIFYRYYPFPQRLQKVLLYGGLYLAKSGVAGKIPTCMRGILAGLRRTDIIRDYRDKLSVSEIRRLDGLNARTARNIRFGR